MGWSKIGGESGGSDRKDIYVQMETGKPARLHAILGKGEEPVSYWTHWIDAAKQSINCPGKSVCPACKAGIKARMMHIMNVWDYAAKKVKVLEKGNTVYESIKMYYEMGNNSLDGVDIVIKSVGDGRDTKYVVASLPMTSALPKEAAGAKHDLEALSAKTEPSQIAQLLGGEKGQDTDFPLPDEQTGVEVVMPTGKYKGMTLIEIVQKDRNYVGWVAENFEDEEIKESANAALESTDRTPVQTKPASKPQPTAKDAKVAQALAMVNTFTSKGGELKAVAQMMKDTAKKTVVKDFSEQELDMFIESMNDLIESLAFDAPV